MVIITNGSYNANRTYEIFESPKTFIHISKILFKFEDKCTAMIILTNVS